MKSKNNITYIILLSPAIVLSVIYQYIPMIGNYIAFQDFNIVKGLFGDQRWVGFGNYKTLFSMPDILPVIRNTIIIASSKTISVLVLSILLSLLLNEIRSNFSKRVMQTVIYFPHFVSWIILSGIFFDILSPQGGVINKILNQLNIDSISFLTSNKWFVPTIVFTNIWKECGFATVIYMAAITRIDPELYEAAEIDGAGRLKQTIHVTIPGISMIIILITVISLPNILRAGFDQVFNLYNPAVYATGDVLDTLIYRLGIEQARYGLSTAVGLVQGIISAMLVGAAYLFAYKKFSYRIF